MILAKLIIQQWKGMLGYEIAPVIQDATQPQLPDDLLRQLLSAGLDMYIRRYLITTVWNPPFLDTGHQKPKSAPYLVYHANPHYREQPLYITTADNTLYELMVCFNNLAPPLDK